MKKLLFLTVACILMIVPGCNPPNPVPYFKISGFAQGTSYHITYSSKDSINLQAVVDSLLKDFDHSLSTYDSSSLISAVNDNRTKVVNSMIKEVFTVAEEIYHLSDGAFDITVMPLVNAWGFGPGREIQLDPEIVDSILTFVGMDKIRIEGMEVVKDHPGISLDVNSIAQGYSVDIVTDFFDSLGIENYMVEIGGELKTHGKNPHGQLWKIGIDRPEYGNMIPGAQLQAILQLNEKALATSGNYRKYVEKNGVKYSHSLDPKTGYPANNSVLSATIIDASCMRADAFATACMVMGMEKAIKMIRDQKLTAYLIYGDTAGQYQAWYTDDMENYIIEQRKK